MPCPNWPPSLLIPKSQLEKENVMGQCCENCRFGHFQRTPTGKPKRKQTGRCMYLIPPLNIPLPVSVLDFNWPPRLGGINPQDGEHCECWEKRETQIEK